jgi:quinoprotein glucose dehydrogenase
MHRTSLKLKKIAACIAVVIVASGIGQPQKSPPAVKHTSSGQQDWPVYGGTPENSRYSSLAQINRENVKQLQVAWSFDSGETGGLQTSPIIVGGALYAYTPSQKVIALNAATGALLWKFDPAAQGWQPDRGLAYWTDGSGKEKRILAGVMNFVYALDAGTGKPIPSFGENGRIDLRKDLGRDPESQIVALTSPAVIYKDLLIVGARVPETLPAPPGDIRAYNVRSGKLVWSFHTIPHPGEFGYDTWPKDAWKYIGSANNWAGMTVDSKRGILYVPTGSAAFDFYGGNRLGDDLFANCLIALKADTGERIWHFQGVRHDIWDRDFPSPPTLVTVRRDGKEIDAVAQTTKQGFVYLFDRSNGQALFPIEYRKYPASDVPGEVTAAEQPLPTKPAPYARQRLTEDLLTNRTPDAHRWAVEQFRKFRSDGQFVPMTVGKDTVVFPGFDGGAEWGGSALDPATGILYVNANEMAWTGALAENTGNESSGRGIYQSQCSVCHRDDMAGSPPQFPALTGIANRMSPQEIGRRISAGNGRMPAFTSLTQDQLFAVVEYVMSGQSKELQSSGTPAVDLKYRFTGYNRFVDPDGYPAIAPPWGTLNAINLNTGEYAWKIPLGEYPELTAQGLKDTGSMNYGGPIVTAGGLLFIGATNFDRKFRAFDKTTGALLWETTLPFSGNGTPATYEVDGRQYVVIAAGGGKDPRQGSGGIYVAFALPRTAVPVTNHISMH